MKRTHWLALIVSCIGLFLGSSGCGQRQPVPPSPEKQADQKLEAIKRLADAMAKDADSPEARGALEDFRNTPLDARVNPKQAEEIVAVYRQRIEGKYKGFVADEIRAEMRSLLPHPK